MFSFARLSFARQFMLGSFFILLVGMIVIGTWVSQHIESGVVQRVGSTTAAYVDSCVAPHLAPVGGSPTTYDPARLSEINHLFAQPGIGGRIVLFKLWTPDGRIVYSTDPTLVGQTFKMEAGVRSAFAGTSSSQISTLPASGNPDPRGPWPRLIESYAPVHAEGSGQVVAVAEFYQSTADLDQEMRTAQMQSWAIVGGATLLMYLLLAGLVGRASATIHKQQDELNDRVTELTAVLEQNQALNKRVHRAAARVADLDEKVLKRLSADLHDGPCQDLGLALLRIDSLAEGCGDCEKPEQGGRSTGQDFRTIRTALQSALSEIRSIASGLWLPSLDGLSPVQVAERAVRDYESKTGATVSVSLENLPESAPLPVKITLYRVMQEALINAFRHASAAGQCAELWVDDGHIYARVADAGPGFDAAAHVPNGHLGLLTMRERVELLGGAFDLRSTPGRGTTIQAKLPLVVPEDTRG